MNDAIACSCRWAGRGVPGTPCPSCTGHAPTRRANGVTRVYTIQDRTATYEAVTVQDALSSVQDHPPGLPSWLYPLYLNGAFVPRPSWVLFRSAEDGWIEARPTDWILCASYNRLRRLRADEVDVSARDGGESNPDAVFRLVG